MKKHGAKVVRPNGLHYGDNLEILRKRIKDESIDLVYLDPPFNSDRSYNVLFKTKSGEDSQAQIEAFDDSWTWSQESETLFEELRYNASGKLADALVAIRQLIGDNDVLAYLVMMAARLIELHRALKDTGSLYLHCDPTASHYLKVLLDTIFGQEHFRNEIIWRRTGAHGKVRRYGPIHDVILFYSKSDQFKWNSPTRPYMRGHVEEYFVKDERGWKTAYYGNVLTGSGKRGGESGKPWRGIDPTSKGRHWAIPGKLIEELDEDLSGLTQHQKLERLYKAGCIQIVPGEAWPRYERYISPSEGTPLSDVWAYQPYTEGTVFETEDGIDAAVKWLSPKDRERLGYPTQKPVALLERIIGASSSEDDIVLDPFCGCGTTVDAAHKLKRRWIGIDITYLAIDLIEKRLRSTYGDSVTKEYSVFGVPKDLAGAVALCDANKFDFERWAVSLVDGTPNEKQVGDKGIDGVIRFPIDRETVGRVMIQVKGGASVGPTAVRDLIGVVESQRAQMGLLIAMAKPTKSMLEAARASGAYVHETTHRRCQRVQVVSVEDLMSGKRPDLPQAILPYVKARPHRGKQLALDVG